MGTSNMVRGRAAVATLMAMVFISVMARAEGPVSRPEKEVEEGLEASLVPYGGVELRLDLRGYSGDVTVVRAVAHGAAMKAGDAVVWLEARGLPLQLATAKNELAAAAAALEKAKSDAVTGTEADRIAMETAAHDLAIARENVAWFESVDGPAMLKESELKVKGAKDSVEDQGDELDQLRKMYKSEELTNATADIVVKRALRGYENGKVNLQLVKAAAEKTPKQEYPVAKLKVQQALATAENGLAVAKAGGR